MIVVIADDLTGAAEIGGIGLRYGLTVEITTTADLNSKADLLIVATDTRSMHKKQALLKTAELSVALYRIKPKLIFKKVDSVLRGHVIAEINIHLQQLGLQRSLLVPGNPALKRILTNGHYYVDSLPVHLSGFADDPEFAISSSNVFDMLRIGPDEASFHTKNDELPDTGIIIGECVAEEDLNAWAGKTDDKTLLAGGAGLFKAMLELMNLKRGSDPCTIPIEPGRPALFVCGSAFGKSKLAVKKVSDKNGPVSFMPIEIILSENLSEQLFDDWADEIISLLEKHKKVIVAIHENTTKNTLVKAANLRDKKAMVILKVFERTTVKELLIEGGSTATAVLETLNISRFFPVAEIAPGVIRMQTDIMIDFFLTLKPGSYDWPMHTWDF